MTAGLVPITRPTPGTGFSELAVPALVAIEGERAATR
jgi:hypothetical protein